VNNLTIPLKGNAFLPQADFLIFSPQSADPARFLKSK